MSSPTPDQQVSRRFVAPPSNIVSALVTYIPPINLEERILKTAQKSVEEILHPSSLLKMTQEEQIATIVKLFNKNVKEPVIVSAGARSGERVEPGMFMLAHCNKVPEVYAGRGERMTLRMTSGYTETGYIGSKDGLHRQTDPLLGEYGSYIVNVPQGMFAKVWSGTIPKILGEGPHVIHDQQFRRDEQFFVSSAEPHIAHGTIHIIRVAVGYLAKVTVNMTPLLLPYRAEPYVFDSAIFAFDGFAAEGSPHIDYSPLHMLRVPGGSVAKVWLGSKPLLLEYRDDPYFFDDPLFRLDGQVLSNVPPRLGGAAPVPVPAPAPGKKAPGKSPAQQQTQFVAAGGSPFVSANLKLVTHGSINRIRPGVDGDLELGVIQHDGEINFVDRFTTIDDPNYVVLGFLNMGMQTLVFPSKETRDERRRENPQCSPDEINFEPMTTKDSLKVGLKLLVAFQIQDPHRVLQRLRLRDIIGHVENLAVSDMARAVQNSTSQNFLNSSNRNSADDLKDENLGISDRVRLELSHHLEDCGLKLVRFNIEEAKVLDEHLAKEMSKQSLVAAQATAEQAVIEQNAAVARSKADMEAMTRRVKQDQENLLTIASAKAQLEATKLEAEGTVVKAEAEQKRNLLMGQLYRKYPQLLDLELAKLQSHALSTSKVSMMACDLSQTPFVEMAPSAITEAPPLTAHSKH